MLYLISAPQKPGEVHLYGWKGVPARLALVTALYSGYLPDGGMLPDRMNFHVAGHTVEFASVGERQSFALGMQIAWELGA